MTAVDGMSVIEHDPLYIAVNSARVCIERFRVRPQSTDLLSTALRELDDAIGLLANHRGAVEALEAIRGQAQQPGLSASDAIEAIIGVLYRYDLARGQ